MLQHGALRPENPAIAPGFFVSGVRMADFVDTTTLALYRSAPAAPTGSSVEITRADYNAAAAIAQQYRKWTGSAVAEMTQAEKDAVDAAAAAAEKAAAKAAAKAFIESLSDQQTVLLRNSLRVVFGSLVETRNKVNELAALAPTVDPLPNRTWTQLKAAVRNQIDAETDPD